MVSEKEGRAAEPSVAFVRYLPGEIAVHRLPGQTPPQGGESEADGQTKL